MEKVAKNGTIFSQQRPGSRPSRLWRGGGVLRARPRATQEEATSWAALRVFVLTDQSVIVTVTVTTTAAQSDRKHDELHYTHLMAFDLMAATARSQVLHDGRRRCRRRSRIVVNVVVVVVVFGTKSIYHPSGFLVARRRGPGQIVISRRLVRPDWAPRTGGSSTITTNRLNSAHRSSLSSAGCTREL